MDWQVDYSEGRGGPYEPLAELSGENWPAAELDLFEGTGGVLGYGYYRVSRRGAADSTVYVWDGQRAALRPVETAS
jgi:hypothetical protein